MLSKKIKINIDDNTIMLKHIKKKNVPKPATKVIVYLTNHTTLYFAQK